MDEHDRIATEVTIVKKGEPLFSETGFTIRIVDEAAGEFVVVECQTEGYGKIALNADEWPILRKEIDAAFERIRE